MWQKGVFDITYLVLHNACETRHVPRGRTVLFDMGASRGFAGVPGGVKHPSPPTVSSNLMPSLPLFWKLLSDRCLAPDKSERGFTWFELAPY